MKMKTFKERVLR